MVPAISFDKTAHTLNDMLINHEIYVTPTDKFQIKFRDVFVDTMLTHNSGKKARRWLLGPNMNLWNEQFKLGRVVFNCWMWGIKSNIISRQNG